MEASTKLPSIMSKHSAVQCVLAWVQLRPMDSVSQSQRFNGGLDTADLYGTSLH